jgi:hypothetical protein
MVVLPEMLTAKTSALAANATAQWRSPKSAVAPENGGQPNGNDPPQADTPQGLRSSRFTDQPDNQSLIDQLTNQPVNQLTRDQCVIA